MKKQTSNKTGILSALASFWNEETIEEYVSLSDINDIDEKTKKVYSFATDCYLNYIGSLYSFIASFHVYNLQGK